MRRSWSTGERGGGIVAPKTKKRLKKFEKGNYILQQRFRNCKHISLTKRTQGKIHVIVITETDAIIIMSLRIGEKVIFFNF